MRAIYSLFVILVLGLAVSGQCSLTLDKAPRLGGAYLGMTAEQAIVRYGTPFSRDKESIGFLESAPVRTAGDLKIQNATNFDGISQLMLTLTGEKVTGILISYKSVEWDSSSEFASALSNKLGLPNAWTTVKGKRTMDCGAWMMTAESNGNMVWLTDWAPIRAKVLADRDAAENKKKVFKP